jgi:hypothetical protein
MTRKFSDEPVVISIPLEELEQYDSCPNSGHSSLGVARRLDKFTEEHPVLLASLPCIPAIFGGWGFWDLLLVPLLLSLVVLGLVKLTGTEDAVPQHTFGFLMITFIAHAVIFSVVNPLLIACVYCFIGGWWLKSSR